MAEHVPALVPTGPRSRAASAAAALRTCGAGLRWFAGTPGPGLLAVAVALAACTSASAPPQPQTARVERTTVFTAVSSSGALSASSEQNLGFLKGGRLTAVNVKVGDRVTAGQVLANLDDGPARRTLEQQQAQLDAQRAVLDRLVNSTTVTGAQNSVEQAQAILDATEDQVDATHDADESALDRAQRQLDFDEDVRDDANDQLDADKKACETTPGSGTATTGTFTSRSRRPRRRHRGRPPPGTDGLDGGTDTGAGSAHQGTSSSSTDPPRAPPRPPDRPAATSHRNVLRLTHRTPVGGACSAVSSDQSAVTRRTGRSRPAAPPATRHGRSATWTPRRARCRSRTPARAGERAEQPRLGRHGPAVDHRPAAGPGRRRRRWRCGRPRPTSTTRCCARPSTAPCRCSTARSGSTSGQAAGRARWRRAAAR